MSIDSDTALRAAEASIVDLMPVATDMIATIVENPAMSWDDYAGLMEAAEINGPLLFITTLRIAAGLAYTMEMTPDQVRDLGKLDPAAATSAAH